MSKSPLNNSLTGLITFHTNLCVTGLWFSMARSLFGDYSVDDNFMVCPENKINFGEDYLIWKLNFSSDVLLFSGNRMLIYLPGKTYNSELKIDNNTLNVKKCNKCYILYGWHPKGSTVVFDETHLIAVFTHYVYLSPKYKYFILSRNLHSDYDKPVPHTWYEAQKMCQNKTTSLPSIVSYNDVEILMKFIRTMTSSALLANFFIGLHIEVC